MEPRTKTNSRLLAARPARRRLFSAALLLCCLSAPCLSFAQKPEIVFPPGPKPYMAPTLFILPYTGGTAEDFLNAYVKWRARSKPLAERFAAMLTRLYPRASERKKRSFILVLPPGRGSVVHHRWKGFMSAVTCYEGHLRSSIDSLSKSRIIDPGRVAVAGHSLGGDLSWALSLRNPDLLSGAIITGSRCAYRKPSAMRELHKKGFRFYMGMGDGEIRVRTKGNRKARNLLSRWKIGFRHFTIPNAGHSKLPLEKLREAIDYVLFR